MQFIGLNQPVRVLLHSQKGLDRAEASYYERMEVDEAARKHMDPEWRAVRDRDPFEGPTPLYFRRFFWEARQRRVDSDRRNPFVEQLLEEDWKEDKGSAHFRAFDDPRPQEKARKASYVDPSAEQMKTPFSEDEIAEMCKPAETYYSKKDAKKASA